MIPADGTWTAAGDRPSGGAGTLGSRGSRSHAVPARPVPVRPEPPRPAPVTTPLALPTRRCAGWTGMLAGSAAGSLIGSSLFGVSWGLLDLLLVGGGIVLLATTLLRRRPAAPVQPTPGAVTVPSSLATPPGDSSLDRGVRDIRQTDARFDPTRFAGYAGMVFRDVHTAWMTRDIGSLRDRLSPEMYGELQVRCDRLRKARHVNHIDRIEIRAEITEAWQESDQDYVTAYIGGSMIDYTVDEATNGLVNGSSAIPKNVEEFWTFTRPAGLNFWMLSAIQTSLVARHPGRAPDAAETHP
jgi:predicted lipid-binding transport protein (Tim44 family)